MGNVDVLQESNDDNGELDPRIQVELENLNTATDEINKLEIELDEANTAFRMLLNDSTRRLKLLSKKLGSCIERARPYYEAVDVAKKAQLDCQKAAAHFQRANEIHAAAKETVALAEERFMSNQHEWQFDNAWQEMLNHATIKVMDAENQRAASGREHQMRAMLFQAAEQKVQQLEERLRRHIIKSRPYFEEKSLCQDQLNTQKDRIGCLEKSVSQVKFSYSQSLKKLELISEEIHQKRNKHVHQKSTDDDSVPSGPREPGVGAELNSPIDETTTAAAATTTTTTGTTTTTKHKQLLPNISYELDLCDVHSCNSSNLSAPASSAVSEKDPNEIDDDDDDNDDDGKNNNDDDNNNDDNVNHGDLNMDDDCELSDLKEKVKQLAIRPVYGGEGCSSDHVWENELSETVNKLDHMMLMKEYAQQLTNEYSKNHSSSSSSTIVPISTSTSSLVVVADDDDNDDGVVSNKADIIISDKNNLSETKQINAATSCPSLNDDGILCENKNNSNNVNNSNTVVAVNTGCTKSD